MISPVDIYHVVAATVPLYFALILAYISVKWWKLFTPQQCAGINKFVAKFSIPLLSFQPSIRTGFSLSTLPNTLILGMPLLKAMYGDEPAGLLAQIVVLQSLIWYNLLLFMFEFNAAKPASEITPTSEDIEDTEAQGKEGEEEAETRASKSKIMLIFLTVEKKLVANPNTHAAWLGLIWAGIRFRWEIKFPAIIQNSLSILASGGLGLFMASQRSRIACGIRMTAVAMVMKFMAGPALIAASSAALGLRADY
ncbi:hypothetical protein Goari_002465 [Gossypium aridum]|uniref:Auxin efflux carrier component n=1 Tax=Gossypium aridum TaxID=34290 RepID=A0A7J8Y8D9_GOSAI|nr:hypothetical protein [Gossypium aridum]